jgi:hypothetical protein
MYYSWDFRLISVHSDHKPPLRQLRTVPVVFSIDVCQICYNDLTKKIIANNANIQSDKRRRFVGTLDDLSGEIMKGTYEFYHCDVSKIDVKMSGQPNLCTKCNHRTFDDDKKCSKCGGLDFIVPADMKIADRVLELAMAEATYNGLQDKAKSVRKIAGEWATKT